MSDDDMSNDVMACQLDMLGGDLWLAHAYDWLDDLLYALDHLS